MQSHWRRRSTSREKRLERRSEDLQKRRQRAAGRVVVPNRPLQQRRPAVAIPGTHRSPVRAGLLSAAFGLTQWLLSWLSANGASRKSPLQRPARPMFLSWSMGSPISLCQPRRIACAASALEDFTIWAVRRRFALAVETKGFTATVQIPGAKRATRRWSISALTTTERAMNVLRVGPSHKAEPSVAPRPGPHFLFARHHAVAAAPASELVRSLAWRSVSCWPSR